MQQLELKLSLLAQQYKSVPHPLYLGKCMPFLKPILQDTAKNEVNEEKLIETGINILVGDGGSGKSVVAKHLAYQAQEGYSPFQHKVTPLFIRLDEHFASIQSLPELYDHLSKVTLSILDEQPQKYQQLVEQKDPLIILDGLDEIFDVKSRQQTLDFIQKTLNQNRILLTSRPNSTLLSQNHYTIKSASKKEALEYAEWILRKQLDGKEIYQDFAQALEKLPFAEIILSNPALFEYARIMYQHTRSMGHNIVDFSERIVNDLVAPTVGTILEKDEFTTSPTEQQYGLRLFDAKFNRGSWNLGGEYQRAIHKIAYHMTLEQKRSMPLDNFIEILNSLFEFEANNCSPREQKQMSQAILYYTPLFCEFEKEVYGFRSLALQDLIGINTLTKRINIKQSYQSSISSRDEKTKEIFFLCLGHQGNGRESLRWFQDEGLIDENTKIPFMNAVKTLGYKL